MLPTLVPNDVVMVSRRLPRAGQMALADIEGRQVVKRVEKIERGRYYLVGDNPDESTDSRHYGAVKKSAILGTIMIGFPTAVEPPKLVKPYGVWLGRIAAVVLAGMALIHLFRIDTFIPIIDAALPSGSGFATFVALVVIFSEVFAIPFALRMRLSPLANIMSGALLVFAPLWWVVIDIMAIGLAENTGQLGEFIVVPASWAVVGANVAWVMFSYYTLYTLGYDQTRPSNFLRK